MARFRGVISLEIPDDASREDVAAYIIDAVGSWKGQCEPPHDNTQGDPMFWLEPDSITLDCVLDGEKVRLVNQ